MYLHCHRKRCYCISDEVQTSPLRHCKPEVAARSKGKWLGKRSKLCLCLWLNRKWGVEKSQYPDKMKRNKSCLLGVPWFINHLQICAKQFCGKEAMEGGSVASQEAWAQSKLFNKQKCAFASGFCDASSRLPTLYLGSHQSQETKNEHPMLWFYLLDLWTLWISVAIIFQGQAMDVPSWLWELLDCYLQAHF